jgi:hypothetical protein
MPAWQRGLAYASHILLYVLMIALPLIGWAMLSAAGNPIVLYGALHLPPILPQDAALYAVLRRIQPSPVVELNGAVAIAMSEGLERGLALVDAIELPGYHWLPAARADLLRRLNRYEESAAAYREALTLVTNEAERRFLERRLAEVMKPLAK